jgi:methionine-rich copper-binding protein CopC
MSFKPLTAASAVLLALSGVPGIVRGHAYPMIVVPPDGATLREPPREIRIQFTESLEMEFSRIVVKTADGEIVSQGKLRRLADDIVAVDLKPLRPGAYRVEWQVLSVDTHVTDGVLRFTVAPMK